MALLGVVLLGMTFASVVVGPSKFNNNLATLSFMATASTTLLFLWFSARRQPVSLYSVHLLALFLFLVAAPFAQFQADSWYHRSVSSPTAGEVVALNVVLLVWLLASGGAYMWGKTGSDGHTRGLAKYFEHRISWPRLKVGLGLAVAALAVLAIRGGFGAFTRAAYSVSATSTASLLILNVFVRAIPLAVLLALIASFRNVGRARTVGWISALAAITIGVLFADNPAAAPRYWTFAFLLGITYVAFPQRQASGLLLMLIVLVGLVVAPVLDIGRNVETLSDLQRAIHFMPPGQYLATSGDFDAFQNTILIQRWTAAEGLAWGAQLLGPLLFFVPRAIWPSKPVGTGHEVAAYFNLPNTNISAPLPAEMWVNFGLAGVVVGATVAGWLMGRVDTWFASTPPETVSLGRILYPVWCGLVFFMTRGDLLSSWAYLVGITLASVLALGHAPWRAGACSWVGSLKEKAQLEAEPASDSQQEARVGTDPQHD